MTRLFDDSRLLSFGQLAARLPRKILREYDEADIRQVFFDTRESLPQYASGERVGIVAETNPEGYFDLPAGVVADRAGMIVGGDEDYGVETEEVRVEAFGENRFRATDHRGCFVSEGSVLMYVWCAYACPSGEPAIRRYPGAMADYFVRAFLASHSLNQALVNPKNLTVATTYERIAANAKAKALSQVKQLLYRPDFYCATQHPVPASRLPPPPRIRPPYGTQTDAE